MRLRRKSILNFGKRLPLRARPSETSHVPGRRIGAGPESGRPPGISGAAAAGITRALCDAYPGRDDGIRHQTVLSAAGAVAGFAAQQAVWREFIVRRRIPQASIMPAT